MDGVKKMSEHQTRFSVDMCLKDQRTGTLTRGHVKRD